MYLDTDTRNNFQMYLDTDTRYSHVSTDTDSNTLYKNNLYKHMREKFIIVHIYILYFILCIYW